MLKKTEKTLTHNFQIMRSIIILTVWISITQIQLASAQSNKVIFKHITKDQGLSSNRMLCITQDKTGFMWFGTENGLTRYDGYDCEIFRNTPDDEYSISSNRINCIVEDKQNGDLWIGTGYGLNYFKKNEFRFYRSFGQQAFDTLVNKTTITSIFIDQTRN